MAQHKGRQTGTIAAPPLLLLFDLASASYAYFPPPRAYPPWKNSRVNEKFATYLNVFTLPVPARRLPFLPSLVLLRRADSRPVDRPHSLSAPSGHCWLFQPRSPGRLCMACQAINSVRGSPAFVVSVKKNNR